MGTDTDCSWAKGKRTDFVAPGSGHDAVVGAVEQPERRAEQAAAEADPQADLNASVEYRQHLARVLTRRALEEASA